MLEKSERFLLNCHWFHKTVFFHRIACSLANYDDSLTFMNRIVTSIWIRIDDQPNVRHTKPLRYMVLFFPWMTRFAWPTSMQNVIDADPKEWGKQIWVNFYTHSVTISMLHFQFRYGLVIAFSLFSHFWHHTTLVLADSLFNYYYQISAPMLRVELWNLATNKKNNSIVWSVFHHWPVTFH